MSPIGEDMATTGSIPHLHGVIITCRGDALAIGRPRHRKHDIRMPPIGEDVAAIGRIPYLHCKIKAPGGDALATGYTCPPDRVPCHCIYAKGMPTIGEDVAAT